MSANRRASLDIRAAVRKLTTEKTRSQIKSALAALTMLWPIRPSFMCRNREGISQYDVSLPGEALGHGISAMFRVHNEERKIWDCLGSILGVFDEIVVVDNASTDSTPALMREFKAKHDNHDVVRLFTYPFEIARLGRENAGTPEDSIHSFTYFSNWCLSKCRSPYVCKWDGDMFLLPEGREDLRAFLRGLSAWRLDLGLLMIQTAYRDPRGRWFLARDEFNSEPMAWPNRASLRFRKDELYELLAWPVYARFRSWPATYPPAYVYELKDTTEDEFSHWSAEDRQSFPTERKQREWQNFEAVRTGDISPERFIELGPNFLPSYPDGATTSGAPSVLSESPRTNADPHHP